tara:strand:- start:930 stop:1532 length:603 start_codon:yes stop_codon:yes gene_type:complete
MKVYKNIKLLFIILSIIIVFLIFVNFFNKGEIKLIKDTKFKIEENTNPIIDEEIYSSNIIENVNYKAKDNKGNEYIINATKGEIDITNSNIIFLTDVVALIKIKNSDNIKITSKFGKYNIKNYDTIFSKSVIVNYLNNKIKSDYLDFSILRDTMIITKDVIYKNLNNVLKADVMEMNLTTKEIKIFMHIDKKKVNVKSLD